MNDLEYNLIKKYKLENDIKARNEVITMNIGYLNTLAAKYHGFMFDDLVNEGIITLIKAIEKYDLNLNPNLITFAHRSLATAMNLYFLKNSDVVNKYTTKPLLKMIRNSNKYIFDGSDDAVIMKELAVSKKDLERFKGMRKSAELDDSDVDFNLVGNNMDNPLDILLSNESNDRILKIQKAISQLDYRSRDIIMGRWINYKDTNTLGYYAKKYGISGERVRQLEQNTIKQLSSMVSI